MRSFMGNGVIAALAVIALDGCAITSPHWDYVPASTSAPIPFQAWTTSNEAPVIVECATDTTAHGNPADGEASYITAVSMPVSGPPSLDAQGATIYSASAKVALPSDCWEYFGDYDFWQANVRMVQTATWSGELRKVAFKSFDLDGLECLGRENGKEASWFAFLNKSCVKTYLGTTTPIPYIVMRIDGYAAGARSARATRSAPIRDRAEARPDVSLPNAPKVLQISPLPKQVLEQIP